VSSRVNPVGWFLVVLFLGGGIFFWITIPGIGIGQIWVGVSLFLVVIYSVIGRRAKAAGRASRAARRSSK
jgi:hypothetical protein